MHPFFGLIRCLDLQRLRARETWPSSTTSSRPSSPFQSPECASTTGFAISPARARLLRLHRLHNNNPAQLRLGQPGRGTIHPYHEPLHTCRLLRPRHHMRQATSSPSAAAPSRKYRVPGDGSVRLLQETAIPYNTNAIAIDHSTDDVYVLARHRRRLLRYSDAGPSSSPPATTTSLRRSSSPATALDQRRPHRRPPLDHLRRLRRRLRALPCRHHGPDPPHLHRTSDAVPLAPLPPLPWTPRRHAVHLRRPRPTLKYNPDTSPRPHPDAPLACTPATGFLDTSRLAR